MADVTGGTPPTGASPFDVPADVKSVYDHFGSAGMFAVANAAALPSSGNWEGRVLVTSDTGGVWVFRSGWRLVSQPWTTYTPTLSNVTATVGLAKFKIDDGLVTVRFRLSVSSVSSNPGMTLPLTAASSAVEHLPGAVALIPSAGSEAPGVVRKSATGSVIFYGMSLAGSNVLINNISAGVPINFSGATIAGTFSYEQA